MMMELTPDAVAPSEPARRADAEIDGRLRRRARAFLSPDEEMPVVASLACEIVERDADRRRASEQLRVAFPDRRPATSNAADGVIHARRIALCPVGSEAIE